MPRITLRQQLHKPSIASANSRCLYSTSPPPSDKDTHTTRENAAASLPSAAESRRSALNTKFSEAMDRLQARALTASQTLNDVTGYSSIETIKADNDAMERTLGAAQERVRSARAAYKTSNTKRAATQREVTTLLARKDTWTPADLERFTELYRTDHVLEGAVASAQEALTTAEADEQGLNQRLNAGILKRYHEEQIWSDRIRRASTWGTWGLMGMNFVLFVLLQFFAEPWRRRRLVRGVVEHEGEVLAGVRAEIEALRTGLEHKMDAALRSRAEEGEMATTTTTTTTTTAPEKEGKGEAETLIGPAQATTWGEFLQDPARWRAAASDLCSERQVHLRMKDATTLVLQGAVAGAAIVGSIAVLAAR
ncbi:Mitochondrial distribution and morphology family 33 [Cordyceps fumosorosea ARSEF 2679]|uniref:Sensitive to high expression protein 9, mitochondrial n=1 Tax=Cordyceps fumosorosea (strain ARSEF 2679) TaxID=1081104 RepID=A0A168B2Y6_CORFA|nr:Mitochondrial distribution and morphology family 33 [Cordyceps fumosorosea ARSEF 2679]OAA69546.1 Mitochondrial distribution and morphology family 33 [Cordyceps fumosorosea ARSEF 2679]